MSKQLISLGAEICPQGIWLQTMAHSGIHFVITETIYICLVFKMLVMFENLAH